MGYGQHSLTGRKTERHPAVFALGVIGIRAGYRKIVLERGTGLLERHRVLHGVRGGLLRIPEKAHLILRGSKSNHSGSSPSRGNIPPRLSAKQSSTNEFEWRQFR